MKRTLLIASKTILAALAFYAGFILGSILAGLLGMSAPSLPAGADAATLGRYLLIVSPILAGTLAFVSRNLAGGLLLRWLILAFLSWIAYGLNTYLEAAIFTAYEAASAYTLFLQLVAVVFCSGLVAWLFPAAVTEVSVRARFRAFVGQYDLRGWTWRILAALMAFPAAYVVFGLLVQPFVIAFYEQQMAGLTLPGWGEIIPILFLRSLLFLLACLPILIVWQGSQRRLFITLSSALFILVGGLYMLQSYWFPLSMRVAHSLEILADSFVYTGMVILLLRSRLDLPVWPISSGRSRLVERMRLLQ